MSSNFLKQILGQPDFEPVPSTRSVGLSLARLFKAGTSRIFCSRRVAAKPTALAILCKGAVDHFTPKMANGYVSFLDSRGPFGRHDKGEIAMSGQRFAGAAC